MDRKAGGGEGKDYYNRMKAFEINKTVKLEMNCLGVSWYLLF